MTKFEAARTQGRGLALGQFEMGVLLAVVALIVFRILGLNEEDEPGSVISDAPDVLPLTNASQIPAEVSRERSETNSSMGEIGAGQCFNSF